MLNANSRPVARPSRNVVVACAALILMLTSCARPALAQSESGSATVVGVTRDQSGAVVPGVTVTARHLATSAARTVVTDSTGRFTLAALPVGAYAIEATLQGFQTIRIEREMLTVGETESLGLTLNPGAVSESVFVTAASPLDRVGTATSTSISEQAIEDLSLPGRISSSRPPRR